MRERGKQRRQVGRGLRPPSLLCAPHPISGGSSAGEEGRACGLPSLVTPLLGRCPCGWLCPQQSLRPQGHGGDERRSGGAAEGLTAP